MPNVFEDLGTGKPRALSILYSLFSFVLVSLWKRGGEGELRVYDCRREGDRPRGPFLSCVQPYFLWPSLSSFPSPPLESLSNISEGGKSFSTVVPFSAAVSREKRSRSHKFRLFCKAGKRQEDVLPFPEKGKVFYSRTKRLFPLFCGKSASQSRFIRSTIFSSPFCWERKGVSECARKSGKPIYAASFSFIFGREEESAYYISPCQVGGRERAKFWPPHTSLRLEIRQRK